VAVVVRMERFLDAPDGPRAVMTIHADGRMIVELPDGMLSLTATELTRHAKEREAAGHREPEKTRVIESKLSSRELDELLRFAIHDQDFFQFDPAEVQAALRDEYQSDGSLHDPTDATTTSLRIQTADREHEVTWSRLTYSAFKFAKVKRLTQLYAVDMRLRHTFNVTKAGGTQGVEAIVKQANQLLHPTYARYPHLPPFTGEDLVGVTPLANGGGTRFTFARYKSVARFSFMAAIDVPLAGQPTIHLIGFPSS
jgi:hypothetical protein